MPSDKEVTGLVEVARSIAEKADNTFAIIIVDNHRIANILANLLERSMDISKKRITKLGPTLGELQEAINLARQRDIVIAPRAILLNSKPVFTTGEAISTIMLVSVQGERATIQYQEKEGNQFTVS